MKKVLTKTLVVTSKKAHENGPFRPNNSLLNGIPPLPPFEKFFKRVYCDPQDTNNLAIIISEKSDLKHNKISALFQ